jgi:HK97 gp10 family phage protein
MRSSVTVKFTGGRELDRALGELGSKALAKGVLTRVGKKRLQPIADRANQLAPDDPSTPGGLHESFIVGTKLNKRQSSLAKKAGKDFVEVYAGTNDPAAVPQEFGTVNHGPQPMLRPAWEEGKGDLLQGLATDIWAEIKKTADRLAKRLAKKASG